MFQSEGALCFTTPKAEHYRDDVSGWKQVLKMSGGWLDIQAWRKWNRKLHNNKKKPSWAKMTRTQKGVHGNIFSTLWKGFLLMHNQPPVFQTTCLFLLVLLPEIVPWGVMVVQKPFFCEGAQVIAVQCWNVLCCFQNRLQVFIWNCCACHAADSGESIKFGSLHPPSWKQVAFHHTHSCTSLTHLSKASMFLFFVCLFFVLHWNENTFWSDWVHTISSRLVVSFDHEVHTKERYA